VAGNGTFQYGRDFLNQMYLWKRFEEYSQLPSKATNELHSIEARYYEMALLRGRLQYKTFSKTLTLNCLLLV